jgi:hypothetical protein
MDPIRQSDETFTTQLQKTLQESEMQRQEQLLTPGKGQQLAPPEVTVSPQLPASRLKAADFLRNPGRTSTSSFAERIGGLLNPARSHPEDFEHMKPPQEPKQSKPPAGGKSPIVLDTEEEDDEEGEEEEKEITQIDKSEEEEYHTETEEEDDDSPPELKKMRTRAAVKSTPVKTKPAPKSASRPSASQGRSSAKKVRKT